MNLKEKVRISVEVSDHQIRRLMDMFYQLYHTVLPEYYRKHVSNDVDSYEYIDGLDHFARLLGYSGFDDINLCNDLASGLYLFCDMKKQVCYARVEEIREITEKMFNGERVDNA